MPRPNRYHPYSRASSQHIPSPRYPPPPSVRLPQTMPSIPEQPPLARPYQYIYPGYITGKTSDGKTLIARQVVQAPDGTFHVQMQVVRFPSEDAAVMRQQSQSPPMLAATNTAGQTPVQIDPALAGLGVKRDEVPRTVSTSAGSVSSRDTESLSGRSEVCAVSSDGEEEEDVEEEIVAPMEDEGQWRAFVEQRMIVQEIERQRRAMGFIQ